MAKKPAIVGWFYKRGKLIPNRAAAVITVVIVAIVLAIFMQVGGLDNLIKSQVATNGIDSSMCSDRTLPAGAVSPAVRVFVPAKNKQDAAKQLPKVLNNDPKLNDGLCDFPGNPTDDQFIKDMIIELNQNYKIYDKKNILKFTLAAQKSAKELALDPKMGLPSMCAEQDPQYCSIKKDNAGKAVVTCGLADKKNGEILAQNCELIGESKLKINGNTTYVYQCGFWCGCAAECISTRPEKPSCATQDEDGNCITPPEDDVKEETWMGPADGGMYGVDGY
jgi:hypothetical protein